MSTTNIVVDSLNYYDKNTEKYSYLFENTKYVKFKITNNDLEHSMIYLYDKNKKEVFKSRYEIIGIFTNFSKTWTWAWSIPHLYKNMAYTSRKILNYGLDLDPNERFLKSELVTSRFRITNSVQTDLHVAIASYLSKNPLIYKYVAYSGNMKGPDDLVEIVTKNDISYSLYYLFILDQ